MQDLMIYIEIMMRWNVIAGFISLMIVNTIAGFDDLYWDYDAGFVSLMIMNHQDLMIYVEIMREI